MNASAPGKRPASELRAEVGRHWPQYRKAIFFSLIVNLLILAPTYFMLEVYDRVVNSRNTTTLLMLLGMVIGAYVVLVLLDAIRAEIMNQAALGIDSALRVRLFDSSFQITLAQGGGTGGAQVFSDLRTLRDFLSSPALMAIMDSPASVVFLVLVFVISPWLGAMAMLGAAVQLVIAARTEKRTMPVLTEANRAGIEAQNYASNTLRNAQVIEAMGMMGSIQRNWMKLQRRTLQLQANASDHNGLNNSVGRLVQTMQGSLILGAAAWLAVTGGLLGGGGMMIVASILGARVLAPLVQLVAQWRAVVNVRDAYARLDQMLEAVPKREPGMSLPPPKGRLTVEAVFANAPGSPVSILRNVSFAAQPGEVLVVAGPSAAGKTTLARLLTGVWPAAAGKVRLDGVDVFGWNKEELGPHVGYLPQGVELFDGTLAENIARFGRVDMGQVRAAAELVGLGPMIAALPEGYDTRIGEDGAILSGGQRQRVALARAIYGTPRFVVLDEPNSSLDEAGEQALARTLQHLKAVGSTIVVVSHRTSVLAVAEKMLILRDGQVALFGPRDEVLAAMQKAVQAQAQARGQQAQGQPPAQGQQGAPRAQPQPPGTLPMPGAAGGTA